MAWSDVLAEEKEQGYFQYILQAVAKARADGEIVYPAKSDIFNAFKYTSLDSVKVVILGQDPYHGPNQAHGLSFSVQKGVVIPPSLKNIYRAIANDLGCSIPKHGCLSSWAQQGVFLLNTHLSVVHAKPQSHAHLGWDKFTGKVLSILAELDRPIVFMLWGAHAQKMASIITNKKHLTLKAAHPSPLSAHRGFLECKHFSQANAWLEKHDSVGIDWSIDN